jgi:hypothetical protein
LGTYIRVGLTALQASQSLCLIGSCSLLFFSCVKSFQQPWQEHPSFVFDGTQKRRGEPSATAPWRSSDGIVSIPSSMRCASTSNPVRTLYPLGVPCTNPRRNTTNPVVFLLYFPCHLGTCLLHASKGPLFPFLCACIIIRVHMTNSCKHSPPTFLCPCVITNGCKVV